MTCCYGAKIETIWIVVAGLDYSSVTQRGLDIPLALLKHGKHTYHLLYAVIPFDITSRERPMRSLRTSVRLHKAMPV